MKKSVDGPIVEGSNLILTCESGGNPAPQQFRWFQDENLLPGESSEQLMFTPIVKEQAGYYICEATNAVGSRLSTDVEVIVYCKYLGCS